VTLNTDIELITAASKSPAVVAAEEAVEEA
jgi:hypothetical protein